MKTVFLRCLLLIVSLFFAACAQAPRALPLSSSAPLLAQPLFAAPQDPFDVALNNSGSYLALAGKNLELYDLQSGAHQTLLAQRVDALCWSYDGNFLAVAVQKANQSVLTIYTAVGRLQTEHSVPGRVSRLQWLKEQPLVASLLEHKTYKFGTHLKASLAQVDRQGSMEILPLYETTINPATAARLGENLFRLFATDLSALGDEVLYARIFAPPAFAAQRRILIRNLASGAERQLAEISLEKGGARLLADGETALVFNGSNQVEQLELWQEAQKASFAATDFSYNAASDWLILDDHLQSRDKQFLLNLPPLAQHWFSANGQHGALNSDGYLYLLANLGVREKPELPRQLREPWQTLRKLRSSGLIDEKDYHMAKEWLFP